MDQHSSELPAPTVCYY